MKGTTILLLGAATLVAYASALPYSKIPEGASLPDAFNYKKSSSNSNSNSYSQSNHDESDVNGAYHGQTFTGSKSSGYSTNGGSHSQSSSFATSSLNGNIPPGIFGFSGVSNTPSTFTQSSLAFGNPGTAGLGLSNKNPGFASGSYVSSYGNSDGGSSNSGSSDDQSVEGVQGSALSGNYNGVIGSIESGVNSDATGGHFGSAGEASFGQAGLPISGSYGAPGSNYFVQGNSQPGTVQYWWNGPDSPFGLEGKPSGGCNSNACSLAGNFDLSKGGAGGAHASNQGGQVGLNVNSGNPFFSKGQGGSGFGSGFISSGASIGQSGIGSGSGADSGFIRRPIDGSHNPFFNGGYSGVTAGNGLNTGSGSFASSNAGAASSGSDTFGSSTSSGGFSGIGNPFLHPTPGSGQIPEFSGPVSTVAPEYTVHQGSGFVNAGSVGSHNPFFNPGSGSVVITPPIAKFPEQSNQGFPTQSTISVTLEPQEQTPGFSTLIPTLGYGSSTPSYPGSSGSFASAETGDFQGQTGQVASFPSQSPIGAGGFSVGYPTPSTLIPEQQPSRIDDGLRVSCSGEGRICVLKEHCVNGKVSGNGQGLMQVRTGNQLCRIDREVCCTLNKYSGLSTTFGSSQSTGFASSGSSSGANSGFSGNHGGFPSSTIRPTLPTPTGSYPGSSGIQGQFGSTISNEQFGNSDQSASLGSSGIFGQTGQFGSAGSDDQSQQQESFKFDAQSDSQASNFGGFSGSTIRPTPSSVIGSHLQSTGFLGTQGQSGQFGSTNNYDKFGNSGQSGIFGQTGQSGSAGSYDQSEQQESIDFVAQSDSKASVGGGSSLGNRGGSGFPSGFSSVTPSPNVISVTPGPGFRKPTVNTFNGGNSGFASASASANAGASGQASSGISGTYTRPTPTPFNRGGFTNTKQPSQANGGLFGSSDNSGEDLTGGEPSFTGTSSGISVGSSASNGYLPPFGSEPSSNVPAFSQPPKEDAKPSVLVPDFKRPPPKQTFPPAPITVQVGCAAALICVEEKFCTLEGVISPQPVALTSQQIERRAPLSSCKNPDNGVIGKCCRDPNYVDPWPTGNLPANYSGGFDEQGFPSYLNYAKTHPAKKQPTKSGFRQPTKGFEATPKPPTKGFIEDVSQQFQDWGFKPPTLPNFEFPTFPNFPQIFGQPSDKPAESSSPTPPDTDTSHAGHEGIPSEAPSGDTQVTQKPTNSFLGIPVPWQNPFGSSTGTKTYELSATNQSPAVIAPHTPGVQCGLRNKVQRPNDLGKDDVAFGEIPWQAMVLSTKERKLLCSGAIVSPNAVLTSAHCVTGFKTGEVSIKAGEWKLGYELKHEEPLPFEIVKVSQIALHPGFQPGSPSHDLAILFLEHPLTLDQHVDFLCLGDKPQPTYGRKCIATGWGKIVLQVNKAGSLMHGIDVDIVPQEACRQRLQGAESQIEIDNTLTCVKPQKQWNNMCQVDVGGPLACDRGDGFYELTGIYSQETGCLPTNQVATYALIDTKWVQTSLVNPPQVPYPSYEIDLPHTGQSSSSVQTNYGSRVQQPAATCECQKSHLPSELNQYLPPV